MITRRSFCRNTIAAGISATVPGLSNTLAGFAKDGLTRQGATRALAHRFLIFGQWNFQPTFADLFEAVVDEAARDGFNGIRVHVPWSSVVAHNGDIDFSFLDEQIDYVVATKRLSCVLLIDHLRQFADGSDSILTPDMVMVDAQGRHSIVPWLPGSQFAFASEKAAAHAAEFTHSVVDRYHRRYGDAILYVSTPVSGYAELEYWPSNWDPALQAYVPGQFDYSPEAVRQFTVWLESRYESIQALNDSWGTGYSAFKTIVPPHDFTDQAGIDWYVFRHAMLKRTINAFASAIHAVSPAIRYVPQIGSTYDTAAPWRGTILFPDLAEHVDAFQVDDAPTYDHPFSMDFLRASLPSPDQWIANEIDGPSTPAGEIDAEYSEQAAQSYAHGAAVVSVANWDLENLQTRGRSLFRKIAEQNLGEPVSRPPWRGQIVASAKAELAEGIGRYQTTYDQLSGGGATAIRVSLAQDL